MTVERIRRVAEDEESLQAVLEGTMRGFYLRCYLRCRLVFLGIYSQYLRTKREYLRIKLERERLMGDRIRARAEAEHAKLLAMVRDARESGVPIPPDVQEIIDRAIVLAGKYGIGVGN
jgi:hypothetical protein